MRIFCIFLSSLFQFYGGSDLIISDLNIGLYRDDGLAVNFLDVTLDLTIERFKPYSKPATTPLYVHRGSNHPPNIIRNIPEAINKRLSEISSDEDAFNEAAPLYQEALRMSGYAYNLKSNPAPQRPPNQDRRRRNIVWFNPPFNRNVLTHVGRAFINLVDKCFPTGHKLRIQ